MEDNATLDIIEVGDFIVKMPSGVQIPEVCANIHGITDKISAKKGVTVRRALASFMQAFCEADMIVAHNEQFDMNMIRVEIERIAFSTTRSAARDHEMYLAAINKSYPPVYCTMKANINFCKLVRTNIRGTYHKYPTLAELFEKLFGRPPPANLHNALNDVMVCLRCFAKQNLGADLLTDSLDYAYLAKSTHLVFP